MVLNITRPFQLLKHKAAAQGEVHTWADGSQHRKVGKKWVQATTAAHSTKAVADVWRVGKQHFDHAMTTNLGERVESILKEEGIDDYESLVEKIKTGPHNTAHKLYKKLVDQIGAGGGTPEDKGAALNLIGTALVKLNEVHASQLKATATMTVVSKKGVEYYKYKETRELPTLKATVVATARKKMGGWSVTGALESKHVKAMITKKTAKLISGKIDPKKKWHFPKKAEDMEIKYKGKHLTVMVKQIKKVAQRTRATAKVEIKIPYAFAKAYLLNHVKSTQTANNLIFRMEHSAGYRVFLERAAA